ncbi:type II toxin-antitoxin system RelE family toxin [Parafilimonas terrae]|uniref:mRNA interferase RelE/StbE n=1 Tax=Parafilimonas terrae TaxID=1465490 RepID=A0A1I5YWL0_9BACT|nr:type II toxin-antitoxin system RelE/ParE family toxin [Parafilimonas terrae]SFQ48638.1 mRNA interferase RelE/StbE [Parafilimonas terrae]
MEVVFTKTFLKDLAKVFPVKRRKEIEHFIFEELQLVSSLEEIDFAEKMKGHKNFYKIRFGDYRMGIYRLENRIELKRVLHRKEIYKYFP